jgi:hypothetical protein
MGNVLKTLLSKMSFKIQLIIFIVFILGCQNKDSKIDKKNYTNDSIKPIQQTPEKNKKIIETVKKFGHKISPTYKQAVCTELVIGVLEKFEYLDDIDKKRIRIIANENIHTLIQGNSPIPQGVYYALIEKGIGIPIDKENVLEGDFVQFWTNTWGHCGIVKKMDLEKNEMELYSSFPSTNGYGVQKFNIPEYCYFVRLK